jgi:hypothetical protein
MCGTPGRELPPDDVCWIQRLFRYGFSWRKIRATTGFGACSSVGRAPHLHCGGRPFDSVQVHFRVVAQSGRAPVLGTGVVRFKSCPRDCFFFLSDKEQAMSDRTTSLRVS